MRPTYPSLPADIARFSGACEITSTSPQFQKAVAVEHEIAKAIEGLHNAATTPQQTQKFDVAHTTHVESPVKTACFPFNPITASILR
jgi:hypothetical protein